MVRLAIFDLISLVRQVDEYERSSSLSTPELLHVLHGDNNTMVKESDDCSCNYLPVLGARYCIDWLREQSIMIAIHSPGPRIDCLKIMDELGWDVSLNRNSHGDGWSFIDLLITAEDLHQPMMEDMVDIAMQRLDLSTSSEIIYIGANTIDVSKAKLRGCACAIGIQSGVGSYSEMWSAGADLIIESPDWIPEYIIQLL